MTTSDLPRKALKAASWRRFSCIFPDGRIETRRYYVFNALDCLPDPSRWPDLRSFAVIEATRDIQGKTTQERRYYISSLAPDANALAKAVHQHWTIKDQVHWCLDVTFADDQMRARTVHAGHNLAILKRLTLNLIRLDPVKHKGSFKMKRILAATSDNYPRSFAWLRMRNLIHVRLP